MARVYTTEINENEFIGDSLATINANFGKLDSLLYSIIPSVTSSVNRPFNVRDYSYTSEIEDDEYLGDSLLTLNTNFLNLDLIYTSFIDYLTSTDTLTNPTTSLSSTAYTIQINENLDITNSLGIINENFRNLGIPLYAMVYSLSGCSFCSSPIVYVSPYTNTIQGPVSYTSFFDVTPYTRYAYEGNYVALLIPEDYPQGGLSATKMFELVLAADKLYQFYKSITGVDPIPLFTYNNKLSIAGYIPSTCGYGCGYLGYTGIEFDETGWPGLRDEALNSQVNTALPYEFGRNFWHGSLYDNKIVYVSPDPPEPVVTGYAVFNRLVAFNYTGLNAGNQGVLTFSQFYQAIRDLINTYLNDNSYTWENTLKINQGVANPYSLGSTDLFASFCLDLSARFGCKFTDNIWKVIVEQPDRTTTQDAVDNFIVAACDVTCSDLRGLFSYYRWPLSLEASNRIEDGNYAPYPVTPPSGPEYNSNWILATGSWDDSGIWIDGETWNDS